MSKPAKKSKRRTKAQKLKHAAVIEVRSGKRETRSYKATGLSVRRAATGEMQLVGTAIVFDSPSQDLGGFTEVVKYQAVQNSLQRNSDVYMLWQHDISQPLTRASKGGLKLTLTPAGLDFVATMPSSPLGETAYRAVADGTVDNVSFGFVCLEDKWIVGDDGSVVRELWDISVSEISPVTFGAYLAPHVDTRSCPLSLRSKLKRDADDEEDETDDDDLDCSDGGDDEDDPRCEDRDLCDCDCQSCQNGDCLDCSDADCDSERCLTNRCGQQERAMHLSIIARRMRRS